MTIPHIALSSSLLLAGNNPSVLGSATPISVQCRPQSDDDRGSNASPDIDDRNNRRKTLRREKTWAYAGLLNNARGAQFFDSFLKNPYQAAYERSNYMPAWLWNRGCSKAMWVARLAEEYEFMKPLQGEVLGRRFGDYTWRSGFVAFALILVPCFLGGLVRFVLTPSAFPHCHKQPTHPFYENSEAVFNRVYLATQLPSLG